MSVEKRTNLRKIDALEENLHHFSRIRILTLFLSILMLEDVSFRQLSDS